MMAKTGNNCIERTGRGLAVWAVRLLAGLLLAAGLFFSAERRAYAGDINPEEARVLAAASGVFYYDNEAYAARPEYISQLSGYLSRDDVDLTASQADAAITRIYENIEQGVLEGYLYKLSDETETSEEEVTTEAPFVSEKPPIMIIPDTTEEVAEENAGDDETSEDADGEKDSPGTAVEDEIKDSAEIEQIKEEDADGSITYDVENHTIVYADKEKETVVELPSIRKPLDVTGYVHTAYLVFLTMLGVILLLALGLYLGKCFPWQRKKRNRKTAKYYVNHKMRGRFRKVTGHTFSVFIAIHVVTGIFLVGAGISVFRESFVMDNLTSSGYYRYIYDDMRQAVHRQLATEDGEAVDRLLSEITYDEFLSASKKQVKKSLSGEESIFEGEALKQELLEISCGLSPEDQEFCVNVIVGNMQTYTMDMVGSSVYGVKQGYKSFVKRTIGIMAGNLLLMALIAILMDRYRHRGVRYIGRGVIVSSALTLLAAVACYLAKPYKEIHMQPASLYLFVKDYSQNGTVILAAIACIGVLLGALLMALVGVVRKLQMEKDE